jgi:hypothetical protein
VTESSTPARGPRAQVPSWLPDWRDTNAYRALRGISDTDWAWQFLRRNRKYQREYARALDAGSLADERLARKWNVTPLPDPAIAVPPDANFTRSRIGILRFSRDGSTLAWRPYEQHELGVILDLRAPLDEQLNVARSAFDDARARLATSDPGLLPKRRQPRRNKFPTYLRLLDADARGEFSIRGGKTNVAAALYQGRDAAAVTALTVDLERAKHFASGGHLEILQLPPAGRPRRRRN